jgi:hypothetical protein
MDPGLNARLALVTRPHPGLLSICGHKYLVDERNEAIRAMKNNETFITFTDADRRFFEALADQLIDSLIERLLCQFARGAPGLSRELERRRRQRRNKGLLTATASGMGAPVPNEIPTSAAAPAAAVAGGAPLGSVRPSPV